MEGIRQYILSVIAISVLCGLAQLLFLGSNHASVVKLITGLMVTITVITPILRDPEISLGIYLDKIAVDGQWAVREGEKAAVTAAGSLIKDRTEAYICDRAAAMGAEITVDITLGDGMPPQPSEVTVRGSVSPYIKRQLVGFIQEELGITEDKQIWIS